MKRIASLGFAVAIAAAGFAQAASYTVGPNDLATGKSGFVPHHGTGTGAFGYDWDTAAPDYAAGAPTGYGYNSMSANVVNGSGGANPETRYRTFRVSPEALTGSPNPLTIADLAGFSWQNFQISGSNTWRVTIYTEPTDVATDPNDGSKPAGDAATWYSSRIQANPTTGSLGVWQTFDSASLTFTENNPSLSLTTGTWANVQSVFGGQRIMMIDFTLGADNGGGTQSAQLDAINFTYGSLTAPVGDSINLEAVPLPSAAGMGLGLVSLMGLARRRKA